jgi:hypothetical protein
MHGHGSVCSKATAAGVQQALCNWQCSAKCCRHTASRTSATVHKLACSEEAHWQATETLVQSALGSSIGGSIAHAAQCICATCITHALLASIEARRHPEHKATRCALGASTRCSRLWSSLVPSTHEHAVHTRTRPLYNFSSLRAASICIPIHQIHQDVWLFAHCILMTWLRQCAVPTRRQCFWSLSACTQLCVGDAACA